MLEEYSLMFDKIHCKISLKFVSIILLILFGIAFPFFIHAASQDSDQLRQRSMEAFKQFEAMTADKRNLTILNMSQTDISMVMLGAAQIKDEINETIQAMAPSNTDVAPIYELRSGNFTSSGNTSKVNGVSRVLSVNENEFLRFERFNITNGPDLHVYFTNEGDLVDSKDLGILKGNIGPQNYFIGDTADQYDTVLIASKPFKIVYAKAILEPIRTD
jgi:hypothetical protein